MPYFEIFLTCLSDFEISTERRAALPVSHHFSLCRRTNSASRTISTQFANKKVISTISKKVCCTTIIYRLNCTRKKDKRTIQWLCCLCCDQWKSLHTGLYGFVYSSIVSLFSFNSLCYELKANQMLRMCCMS